MHIATDVEENHIGRLVKWAHMKIEKEIKLNEKLEEEFGSKAVKEEKSRCRYDLSLEQKSEILRKIESFKQEGYSMKEACASVDIHPQTYYKWKKLVNQS